MISPPNSTVDIKVTKQNGKVRVAVKDKGIGIDKKLHPLIFQKFSQIDNTDKRHSGGTGLGLAISKGLAEKMGGEIEFTSTIGKGSTFYFELQEA